LLIENSTQARMVQTMATSLAFGLGFGTLLVLVVIPCVLTYIEDLNSFRQRSWQKLKSLRKPKAQQSPS